MEKSAGTNADFAEWAKRVAKGRSLRELSRATGISHTRISDLHFGVIPSFRLLEKYCDALGLASEDRFQGFILAGYTNDANTLEDAAFRLAQVARSDPERFADAMDFGFRGGNLPQESRDALERLFRNADEEEDRRKGRG